MGQELVEIKIQTTETLDTILHQILNLALVAIDAEAGSLMLVDKKRGILQIKARLGKPRPGRKTEPVYKIDEKGIAGWVVQSKNAYLCPDVENDNLFTISHSGKNFLSVLSVPVVYEDRVLAVINADAAEKNYFTKVHMEKLESVARQVATPVAERISILDALAEVGVELSRLPREGGVEPVLRRIAQLAVRSLGADVVTLYQYVQEKDEFPVEGKGPTIAGEVRDPRPMRRKIHAVDVPWTVVKQRKPGFYPDAHEVDFLTNEVERPGDSPRARFIEREAIKSMAALLLPFRAAEDKDEEVVGVMFVNYRTHHEFNIDEISALATFADYAAVAILNARREEQRRTEQKRAEEQQRAEQMTRIVETILANFAHRMSNMAGTSRVATQILREHINPADRLLCRQLDQIEHESGVLLDLAERLARRFKETGGLFELVPIEITTLIEEELERIQSSLTDIRVTKEIYPGTPRVHSDESQLRQVLQDIISNAVEAMQGQDRRELTVRAWFNGGTHRVEVEVSDTGPGIRTDIMDRWFVPGITTKQHKLGIGLWWCRTFMLATGGDVVLKDTQPGKGTTFVVEIPCVHERDKWDTGTLTALPTEDILIVDDEQKWRDQLMDIVANEWYSIETVDSYAAASRIMATKHFKLVIVDIVLAGADPENEDGLRLLTDIEEAGLDTRVIVVTGHCTEQRLQAAGRSRRLLAFVDKAKLSVPEFRALVHSAVQTAER